MINLAAHLNTPGEIAVIPTDTVYGVVGRVSDEQAVARLYRLKRRQNKPGTLIAATVHQLVELGIEQHYLVNLDQFWPGQVSIIMPCSESLRYIHQGLNSLAIRIPNDPWLLDLLQQTGPPLTSSANQPGDPPATTIIEARNYFEEQVTWYEDGGVVNRDPSAVIKIVNDKIDVIRSGSVSIEGKSITPFKK